MNENNFKIFRSIANVIGSDINVEEHANFFSKNGSQRIGYGSVLQVMKRLGCEKEQAVLATLLRMSRLPSTDSKISDDFDFSLIYGGNVLELRNLASLSEVYARTNIALTDSSRTWKTRISKSIGLKHCESGMDMYFLKSTELREKLTNSNEESVVNNLVKSTCLVIDVVGRYVSDKENARMFFDIVDRRYSKDTINTMIFTSNMMPNK